MNVCLTADLVNKKEMSARSITEAALENCRLLNKKLNTLAQVGGSEALQQADAVDCKIDQGFNLPLAGVPLVISDNFCYQSLPTGFGSKAFKSFYTPYNATAVEKIIASGAVIVGKANINDMGLDSTTVSSPSGPALNPWDRCRIVGSAAAAAVAAGQCLLSLDSDSAGSLRQGASQNGVAGLRPSAGRISRYGLQLASSSFGLVGMSAPKAEDLAAVLKVLSGFDPRDATTASFKENSFSSPADYKEAKVAIGLPSGLPALLDKEFLAIIERVRDKLLELGFQTGEFNPGHFKEALRAYYVINMAETSSSFSRFDGIRFGETAGAENLEQHYGESRFLAFGREARRRSVFGAYFLSKDAYELYYRQALKVRALFQEEFSNFFSRFDCLILPTEKTLPPMAEEKTDFINLYENDIFTAPLSMTGCPVLTVPCGKLKTMPVGLQLVGPPFSEELLLKIGAKLCENANLLSLQSSLKEGI